jgi:hypothetical protein
MDEEQLTNNNNETVIGHNNKPQSILTVQPSYREYAGTFNINGSATVDNNSQQKQDENSNNTTSCRCQIVIIAIQILTSFSMGTAFGFVLDRSGVMLPATIRAQFLFTREVMLKMWLAAVGVSALMHIISSSVHPDVFARIRSHREYGEKGVITLVAGGFIQGMGMACTGACPGMTWGQMGSGVPYAPYTFLGAMLGALLFSLLHPLMHSWMLKDFNYTLKPYFKTGYLDIDFNLPFRPSAFIFTVLVFVIVGIFEGVFYWGTDLIGVAGARTLATDLMNPTFAGVIVGLLQLPAFFIMGDFLGTSSAYSVCTSQILRVVPKNAEIRKDFVYAVQHENSPSWWQICYGLGALLGGYLSAFVAMPPRPSEPNGVGIGFALGGGVLLVFGARLAGGCASGHGLTGLSIMSIKGFIVVPMMYAGAISLGFLLDFLNVGYVL